MCACSRHSGKEVLSSGEDPCGNVMFCHARPFPPGCRRGPPLGLRRGSVAVMRASSFQAKGGTGVSLFRACRAPARAGVGAGAVRAADCARETAHAPLALAHAGGFSAPSRSLSAETPKGGPGSRLSLLSFYTMPPNVKPGLEQKMKIRIFFMQCRRKRARIDTLRPDAFPAMPSPRHASPRHARTCSGHPLSPLPPNDRMDARNKSGHDGGGRWGMTEEPARSPSKGAHSGTRKRGRGGMMERVRGSGVPRRP